jgi:hypothetical protein
MFPLMAQSVNDSKEAKEEMRKERMEQYQLMQSKMWKQQEHKRKAGVDEMIMRMKMHDRKIVNQHKHNHKKNLYHRKHHHTMDKSKTKRIVGGIVIFTLGYLVGTNDDHRGKKHHKKNKNFKGDR